MVALEREPRDERVWRAAFVVLLGVVALACAAPPPRIPKEPPVGRDTYDYSWNPPQDKAASPMGFTVAVVRPLYADQDSALAEPGYRRFAKGFAKSMGVDLDKVLVAKGLRVSGPFETWDDITYPDKQSAELALTPRVFLTTVAKYDRDRSPRAMGRGEARPRSVGMMGGGGGGAAKKAGKGDGLVENDGQVDYIERPVWLTVQGHVAFELREPLSNQKLWVKKLELEPADVQTVECYEAEGLTNSEGYTYAFRAGKLLYDGKQDALADLMQTWYPDIMKKAWTFIDPQEMANMRPQVEEIRKNKRY